MTTLVPAPDRTHRTAKWCLHLGVLALAGLLSGCGAGGDESQRPNLVLIVIDTMRGDVEIGPETLTEAPGLARLAEEGIVFSHAFSHAPMTLPSHSALFSSRPPFETRVFNNWQDVREDLPLFAEWLGRYGYETHAVLSLGTLNPGRRTGLDRGFDFYDQEYWHMSRAEDSFARMRERLDELDTSSPFFFFAHFSDPHEPYNWHGGRDHSVDVSLNGESMTTLATSDMSQWEYEVEMEPGRHAVELQSEHEHVVKDFQWRDADTNEFLKAEWEINEPQTRATESRCSITLDRKRNVRIRIWVAETAPRDEVRRLYAGEVGYAVRHVGQLITELQERGLYEDSIVLLTSDHGEALGERGIVGHVANLHDEMLHVPLILKLPKDHVDTENLRGHADRLVPHQDLVPTLLELMVVPELPGQRGTSLLREREPLLIAETHKPEASRNLVCFRDERLKLIYDSDAETFSLFDMVEDPEEQTDVFEERRAEVEDWVDQIRSVGLAAASSGGPGEIDEETRAKLDALGYGGGE